MRRPNGTLDEPYESEFAQRRKLHRGDYTIVSMALKGRHAFRDIVPTMSRYLLVADVHSNLPALEAVLDDAAEQGGFDCIWMLGDIVGYGPQPDECVERLRRESLICIAGNHDLGAVGRTDLSCFNTYAAQACAWSGTRLSDSSTRYLLQLPLRHRVSPFLLVHGSPRDPIREYITSPEQAVELAPYCDEVHCVVGHTHCPSMLTMSVTPEAAAAPFAATGQVVLRGRFIINPGSVGQPRDGDPRAAYAILDTEVGTVSFRRIAYDVSATADLMLKMGLPVPLARRLHAGY